MYHLELRQSFHNLNRLNLDEAQMLAIAVPWAQEKQVEVGERKWSPHQAKLKILQGPHLELSELSMGRGWKAATRRSQDVTDSVLERIRTDLAANRHAGPAPALSADPVQGAAGPEQGAAGPAQGAADPAVGAGDTAIGAGGPAAGAGDTARHGAGDPTPDDFDATPEQLQLASLLGGDAERLLASWRQIAERAPGLTPSESLALAERQISAHPPAR